MHLNFYILKTLLLSFNTLYNKCIYFLICQTFILILQQSVWKMFTNTLKFLYFLSPINFMSSYIFNVIIYFYLSPVHIENSFKFSNLILHCQQIFYFVIYFQKNQVCYILSKIRCCCVCRPSFTFALSSVIYILHNISLIHILHQTLRFIYNSTPFSTIWFLTSLAGTALPHNLV